MDLGNFINTYQYILLPVLLAVTAGLIFTTWLALVLWTSRDITIRSKNLLVIILCILLVLFFNLPGLLIYLLVRPQQTIDERKNYALLYQSILDKDVINCSKCSLPMRSNHEFCPNCGSSQNTKCSQCGAQVNPLWSHCADCGNDLHPRTPVLQKFNQTTLTLKSSIAAVSSNLFNLPSKFWQTYLLTISRLVRRFPKPTSPKKRVQSKQETPKIKTVSEGIKYNKDGTPRKPRNDAGQKRGKYKPRKK